MVIFSMAFRTAYHCTLKRAAPQQRATKWWLVHPANLSDVYIFSGFFHFQLDTLLQSIDLTTFNYISLPRLALCLLQLPSLASASHILTYKTCSLCSIAQAVRPREGAERAWRHIPPSISHNRQTERRQSFSSPPWWHFRIVSPEGALQVFLVTK